MVVWSAQYSAFGEATAEIETIKNHLRFPGQYYDAETGLHYNYHRYYDLDTSRYMSTDPIGLKGGEVNLYAYVRNNPVGSFDNLGLLTGYYLDKGFMRDGAYGWDYLYRQHECSIELRIKLIGVPAGAGLIHVWEQGIEGKWNNQFGCCEQEGLTPDGFCCKDFCLVNVDVEFVDLTGLPIERALSIEVGEDVIVHVRPGPVRSNVFFWDTQDTGDVAAHEFGHHLGLKDEYLDALFAPSRSPVNTGTVMHDNVGPAVERHFSNICNNIGKVVFSPWDVIK